MRISIIRRLMAIKVPGFIASGSAQTSTARSYIGYALDAKHVLDTQQQVCQAEGGRKHVDYDPEIDADPDALLTALEAWRRRRVQEGWSFDGAGEKT